MYILFTKVQCPLKKQQYSNTSSIGTVCHTFCKYIKYIQVHECVIYLCMVLWTVFT